MDSINSSNSDIISTEISEYYSSSDVNNKILNLLNLDNDEENEQFLELFNIDDDFILEIKPFEDKTIYEFTLNKSGIEKISKIRKYLFLKEKITKEINTDFAFTKTMTSIDRYNASQEKDNLKIDGIEKLEYRIVELENGVSGDSKTKLKELEINYFNEKERELRQSNRKKEFTEILKTLNIDLELDELITQYHLQNDFKNYLNLFSKDNIGYSVTIENEREKKIYTNNKIKSKNVFDSLFKYKKTIMFFTFIGIVYSLIDSGNGKKEIIPFETIHKNNKNLKKEMDLNLLASHGSILSEGMTNYYIYSKKHNDDFNLTKKDFFLTYLEGNLLNHFSNLHVSRDLKADIEATYNEEKRTIEINGEFKKNSDEGYDISSSYPIFTDDEFRKISLTEDYKIFEKNYIIIDSYLKNILRSCIDETGKEYNYSYDDNYLEKFKENLSKLMLTKESEKFSDINLLGTRLKNSLLISRGSKIDGKNMKLYYSILFNGKAYFLNYNIGKNVN